VNSQLAELLLRLLVRLLRHHRTKRHLGYLLAGGGVQAGVMSKINGSRIKRLTWNNTPFLDCQALCALQSFPLSITADALSQLRGSPPSQMNFHRAARDRSRTAAAHPTSRGQTTAAPNKQSVHAGPKLALPVAP
jgi:hypothetical protein